MASKLTIPLTDQDESDLAEYNLTDPVDAAAAFYDAFMTRNITPAAAEKRKQERLAAIAQKRAALDDPAKQAALDATLKQIELTKTAEILDEQEAAAEAMTGVDTVTGEPTEPLTLFQRGLNAIKGILK